MQGVRFPFAGLSSHGVPLFFQILLQGPDGLVGIAVFLVEQGDKTAADDGARRMGTGCFEGLPVADAEAYHARIAQVHGLNLAEVGLFPLVEVLLRAGGCRARHHVDEAIRVGVDFADAGFAGFRRDEHDDFDAVALGGGPVAFLIFAERQVGDDDAVDAARRTLPAECLESELHDGVEVAHQDEGDADVPADVPQLPEEQAEGHAVAQGAGGGFLDDNAVGHGVAEGDAYLNHAHAVAFKGADDVGGAVQCGAAGAEVDGEQVGGMALEELVDTVLHIVFRVKVRG